MITPQELFYYTLGAGKSIRSCKDRLHNKKYNEVGAR